MMTQKQKEELQKMKMELGIIEYSEHVCLEDGKADNETVEINGKYYDVCEEMSRSELDEYLKVQNAYNILKIRRGVRFFVILAVVGLVGSLIVKLISLL